MQLHIAHDMRYIYDRPVFFEPMLIRLCPRHDHRQQLLNFEVAVTPTPTGSTEILDAHNNRAQVVWFDGVHPRLEIQSRSQLRMLSSSPFDYLVTDPKVERLPATYAPSLASSLTVFRDRRHPVQAIDALAEQLRQQSQGQTLEYLRRLVLYVPNHCTQIHRHEGAAWPAEQTLQRREGSCRDLTLLFIEACRAMGLAARFVSGYCSITTLHQANELHAWAEVYLPGGGWRGYDPTLGVATSHQHIALATAAEPEGAAPTEGDYRGTDATSAFDYEIRMELQPA